MEKIRVKQRIIRTKKEKVIMAIVFVIMVIYATTLVYPFIYVLLNSFKGENVLNNPLGWPQQFTFQNYIDAFVKIKVNNTTLPGLFLNSLTLTVGQTFVTMSMTCMAAYVLAKYKFKGSGFLYSFIIIASVVPAVGAEAATYKLMNKTLHLTNNYFGMMIMCGAFGGVFLYLHSFFKQIPWTYAESAMIDGASDFRVFLQIYVPLAKNGILIFTIMNALGYWNEYWKASLYYGKRPTLAVGITLIQNKTPGVYTYGIYFAGLMICIIPILIFYCFFANKLVDNLTGGGIKG